MIKRNWILEWQLDCLPWSDLIESSRFLHGFLLIFLAVDDQAEEFTLAIYVLPREIKRTGYRSSLCKDARKHTPDLFSSSRRGPPVPAE